MPKIINTWHGIGCRIAFLIRSILAGTLFLLLLQTCLAQSTNKNYPLQLSQFMVAYPLINPATIGLKANYEVLMGYQRPVSDFTGISTYYCNLGFIPYRLKSSAKSKSFAGLRFYNDNEGAYINRMRLYGIYAFHTPINNWLNFAGGIDFGGMNFAVKATPTTEGASVFRPDANAGIWFYNDEFHLGFSVNQLFNSVFQPIDERTVLPTYLNLTGSYAVVKNDVMELRPHLLITFPYYSKTDVQACFQGLFFGKLIAAVGWNYKTSVSAMLGIHDLSLYKSNMNVILSYVTSAGKVALGINKLEISVFCSFQ